MIARGVASCTQGYQGNWVRANTIEALCNYQMISGSHEYDDAIAAAFPHKSFEINAAAPYKCDPDAPGDGQAMPHSDPGWPYYDDILWWALAALRAADMYTLRGESELATKMTSRSNEIFENVAARAWNETEAACGGGIWWSTSRGYKNAIANELFFATASKLKKTDWATKAWKWFKNSGMINNMSLVNDGLDKDCSNNGRTTFTYNQGVLLGGLSHLHALTGDVDLLNQASRVINAVLQHLTDGNGVLAEVDCGDGGLFKGIFVRYLRYFIDANKATIQSADLANWSQFLIANAESLWKSQDAEGKFPVYWGGAAPMMFPSGTVNLQTAAIDAFAAAAAAPAPGIDASKNVSLGEGSAAGWCNSAGRRVSLHQTDGSWEHRCVCNLRFTGAECQREIDWVAYYGSQGRKVLVMTAHGRFISSKADRHPNPCMAHTSTEEYWSAQRCGSGVALVGSAGLFLAIDDDPDASTDTKSDALIAEIVMLNATDVDCNDLHSPASWHVNITAGGETGETLVLTSASRPAMPNTAWYLTTDTDPIGAEGLIAVAATPAQAASAEGGLLHLRVRAQQFCQSL